MFSNFLANLCIVVVDDHRMYFFRMSNFTASVNCETGNCLVYKPILYESAMFCMDLHVANLGMTTATFTWTGIADRMLVSLSMHRRRESGTQKLKCGNIHTHSPLELPRIERSEQVSIKETRLLQPYLVGRQTSGPLRTRHHENSHRNRHVTHLLPMPN